MAALGKNLNMTPSDQVGILQSDREGYATPQSVGASLAQFTVSPMAGNQLTVGIDGLLYIDTLVGASITVSGYTVTYNGAGGSISWDDGRVSFDAGNIVSRGTDGGLFAPSDAITVAPNTYTFTHVSCLGVAATWDDGRVSTDANNILVRGSDGGLFVPDAIGGTVTKVNYTLTWTDGANSVQWEDGCISADPGNSITRGSDGCLFSPAAFLTRQANGYTMLFQFGTNPPVLFDDGFISGDPGNGLSRGTDAGLFVASDFISIAPNTYSLTHTAIDGNAVSWDDGRLSGDAGNVLSRGTDGGLYYGGGAGSAPASAETLEVWVDTVSGDDTNDGLTSATPIKTQTRLASVVTANPAVNRVEVVMRGAFNAGFSLATTFLRHHHVLLRSWDSDPAQTVWVPATTSLSSVGVESLEIRDGSVGRLVADGADVRLSGSFTGRILAANATIVRGSIGTWTAPPAAVSEHSLAAADSSFVNIQAGSVIADAGDAAFNGVSFIAVGGSSRVSLTSPSMTVTLRSTNGAFAITEAGSMANVAANNISVSASGSVNRLLEGSGDMSVSVTSQLSVNLPNGAGNRLVSAAGADVSLFAGVLDASVAADFSGVFHATNAAFVRCNFGVVQNSFGGAAGESIRCESGSDMRIFGYDSGLVVLDRDSLVTALGVAGPGGLSGAANVRIGDTYYQSPVVSPY